MSYVAELISRVVSAHDLAPNDYGVKLEFFSEFADEWRFLLDYYKRNRSLPNVATFTAQFPDFPFQHTERNAQWLLDEVEQDFIGRHTQAQLSDVLALNDVNPREAVSRLYDTAVFLKQMAAVHRLRESLNNGTFPDDSVAWRKELAKITTGVPTGFDLLDEVTSGTQPGELEIWFGRPGEGKSLMLMRSAIAARRSGFSVCYVSPEMTYRENMIRYQSMTVHVSAAGLFSAKLTDAEYDAFIMRKKQYEDETTDYGILHHRDAVGRGARFTTNDIAHFIKLDTPGIVIIDGLMLLEPAVSDRDPRKRIINIMEELKAISTDTNVPIRLAHQANRESDVKAQRKSKKHVIDELIPDLSHLAESGAVEQYANKAIAIKQTHGRTYIALRKNRNGKAPRFISFGHDIDQGLIWDVRLEQASLDPSERDESIIPQNENVDTSKFPRMPF